MSILRSGVLIFPCQVSWEISKVFLLALNFQVNVITLLC